MQPSFWVETTPETAYPPLDGEGSVDVAVLGAGITGLTAATLVKAAGKTVGRVESKRIDGGSSGYTTANVTDGAGMSYVRIGSG